MADNQQQFYPPVGFYFNVIVDDITGVYEAGFESVSGLDVKIETETIQEGGVNQFTRKLPKGLQYSNLVLKRGLIKGSPLMTWINKAVQNFIFEPKRIQVNLLNEKGTPSINWSFYNAYPVSVKVSDLNSRDEKYVIETLEFAFDYYVRIDK
jgi:phage tail-like protein